MSETETERLPSMAFANDAVYRITGPFFRAGITVAHDGTVTYAEPIVGWLFNTNIAHVRRCCADRGWLLECVSESASE